MTPVQFYKCDGCQNMIPTYQQHLCPGPARPWYPLEQFRPPFAPIIATDSTASPVKKGWECPRCSAVMAPFVPSCVNCKGTGE